MPRPLKKFLVKLSLVLLEGLKYAGKFLLIVLTVLFTPFIWVWKYVLRHLFFLAYRLLLRVKIATNTLVEPFRKTLMAVLGHRYVVHVMMAIIVLFVAVKSVYARDLELGAATHQSLIYDILQPYIQSQSDIDTTAPSGSDVLTADESATSTYQLLVYDQSGVVKPFPLPETQPGAPPPEQHELISKPVPYVVQDGDTISGIAKKYGVSIATVLWANDMTARSLIRPGQTLTILPVDGVLHHVAKGETVGAIAKKYGVKVDDILQANRVASADEIHAGEDLIVPGGTPPARPAPQPPSRLGSVANVFKPPSAAPPPSRVVAGTQLSWPTDQHLINQYFKWSHPGVDINGNLSNSIYAADDGIVTFAGWNKGGYGNMILIDHGNGIITRYGHASVIYVHAGDQVKKGQTIAQIGSTGHSTGPHLHFEVYVGGKRVNPLEFFR